MVGRLLTFIIVVTIVLTAYQLLFGSLTLALYGFGLLCLEATVGWLLRR